MVTVARATSNTAPARLFYRREQESAGKPTYNVRQNDIEFSHALTFVNALIPQPFSSSPVSLFDSVIRRLCVMVSSSDTVSLPSVGAHLLLSLPAPHVLQLTFNRPEQLNAMTDALEADICRTLDWFEAEPSLWVVILSGKGRAFCAGQDLKDWLAKNRGNVVTVKHSSGEPMQADSEVQKSVNRMKTGGFGGMSARRSTKPILAAVDGICMGGGTETILNCDLVVASSRSVFGLPEVARGVVAAMGGIPRLSQLAGHVSSLPHVEPSHLHLFY